MQACQGTPCRFTVPLAQVTDYAWPLRTFTVAPPPLKATKVQPLQLYSLRHTFETRTAESGIDPVTLGTMVEELRMQILLC